MHAGCRYTCQSVGWVTKHVSGSQGLSRCVAGDRNAWWGAWGVGWEVETCSWGQNAWWRLETVNWGVATHGWRSAGVHYKKINQKTHENLEKKTHLGPKQCETHCLGPFLSSPPPKNLLMLSRHKYKLKNNI
jgi:hypothetical protein